MTKANTIVRTPAAPAMAVSKLGAARKSAFMAIAPNAFSEAQSRAASIANLQTAIGKSPSEATLAAAKVEWVIGRAAFRLPAVEYGKGMAGDTMAKLLFMRERVTDYAAPVKEGAKAKKLRAGQKGRRTAMQHRVIRNAEEAWSQVLAELGLNNAKTQGERNAAKNTAAPSMAGSGKGKAKEAALPAHAALVTPAKADTPTAFAGQIVHMLDTAVKYANKNAKVMPLEFTEIVQQLIGLHKSALKSDGVFHVRIAAANAVKADKSK